MNETLPISELDSERKHACAEASEREMVKYFLGGLSSEKEQQLERLFFADDQLFDQLQAVKEKLIDDYLRHRLNEQERALFEQNFLSSPSQREQTEFAHALMKKLSQPS